MISAWTVVAAVAGTALDRNLRSLSAGPAKLGWTNPSTHGARNRLRSRVLRRAGFTSYQPHQRQPRHEGWRRDSDRRAFEQRLLPETSVSASALSCYLGTVLQERDNESPARDTRSAQRSSPSATLTSTRAPARGRHRTRKRRPLDRPELARSTLYLVTGSANQPVATPGQV